MVAQKAQRGLQLKPYAFSQFAKPSLANPTAFWPTPARNATEIMGYSVRDAEWRYTCWFKFDGASVSVLTHEVIADELYDHRGDWGDPDWPGERVNVVEVAEHAAVRARLHAAVLGYIQLRPASAYT